MTEGLQEYQDEAEMNIELLAAFLSKRFSIPDRFGSTPELRRKTSAAREARRKARKHRKLMMKRSRK